MAEVIHTRWADNDLYGHLNNVTYYSLLDTAINRYLIGTVGIDIHAGAVIAFVVETGCRYHAALEYPQTVEVGLKVARLGTSSVTWHGGFFVAPAAPDALAAADAHFTHVLVDRETRRPTPWPEAMRAALSAVSG